MRFSQISKLLTCSRFVAGPLIAILAFYRSSPILIVLLLSYGLFSDILDGVLARRMKVVTEELRVLDSKADTVYYVCVVSAILVTHTRQVAPYWQGIASFSAAELATTVTDYFRYGRICSYHTYSSKMLGLSCFVLSVAVLATGRVAPYMMICITLGLYKDVEGFVIRYLLRDWTYDVASIPAALRIRHARRLLDV